MPRATAVQKKADRNAELAAERAALLENDAVTVDDSPSADPSAHDVWLSWQKGNPQLNPFLSPQFLVDAWCLASEDDVPVPLLPAIPVPAVIASMREACRLSVERVAELAQVSAEQWVLLEHGDTSVLDFIDANRLLRFCSVMAVCVAAGGPPDLGEPEPLPKRPPLTVVGAELLPELERAAEERRVPLAHVPVDDVLSAQIARGELPSPTLTDWPSETEAAKLIAAFPGLANRRRPCVWTNGSVLADFIEQEDHSEAPFIPRDELGVGKPGLLRVLGTMAAIVQSDPQRVEAIAYARQKAQDERREREAASTRARQNAAQAALLVAQAEYEGAKEAVG